jgi:predicted permease
MAEILQDIRYGLRQLRRGPGFTVAAVACLALGIGANTAAFSFAWSVLFSDPPIEGPERMVRLFTHWDSGLEFGSLSYPDYEDFRDRSGAVLETLAAEVLSPVHLSAGDDNQRIWAVLATMNYFSDLKVPMVVGRGFSPEDGYAPGSVPLAVLSHRAWVNRFAADPEVVGGEVLLNGHPFTVVGVSSPEFLGATPGVAGEIYVPMPMAREIQPGYDFLEQRGSHNLGFVMGRMRPDVSFERTRTELAALADELRTEFPATNEGKGLKVIPQSDALPHPMVRQGFVNAIVLVFVVVGFILLLACANVAGLLLARAASRRKEIGIRMALGGGRGRLVRQLLVESSLLAVLGGIAGFLLSVVLGRGLLAAVPPSDFPMYMEYRLQPQVLAFTLAASIFTGAVFGLLPAVRATRGDLLPDLKEGAPGHSGRGGAGLRTALVVGQVAMSLVLLVSAGFVLRSLGAISELDPGFVVDNQLIANVDLDLQGYDEAAGRDFVRDLRARLESSPQVDAVGYATILPLAFSSSSSSVVPEGYEHLTASEVPNIDRNVVDHGYFEAAGVTLRRGRFFREQDGPDTPRVMVVNQSFVDRFWPDESGVGKRVRSGGTDFEVVGVVENGKYLTLGEKPKPFFFRSLDQSYAGGLVLHVRSAGEPEGVIGLVRSEVAALDDKLPLSNLRTMQAHMRFATLPSRMMAGVVSGFAFVALLLAAVGLYGVLAFWVSQGARELAIRVALGARPRDVVGQVVLRGLAMSLGGLALGLLASFGIGRLLSSLVYGVSATDPAAYSLATVVLLAAATLAALIPALRASHVDPVRVLR